MLITIIASIALFFSLAVLGIIIARRIPELTVVTSDLPVNGHSLSTKNKILEARVERQMRGVVKLIEKIMRRPFFSLSQTVRAIWHNFEDYLKTHRSFLLRRRTEKAFVAIRGHMAAVEVALQNGDDAAAERELIDVVRINPRHAEAYANLGSIYFKRHEFEHAKEVYTLVEKLAGKSEETQIRLGEIEVALNSPKRALAHYETALTFSPRSPKLLDAAIEVALQAGENVMARDLVERLRLANPDNEKIFDFEARLKS